MTEKHFITLGDINVEVENLTVEPVIEPTEDNIDEILQSPDPNIRFSCKLTDETTVRELQDMFDKITLKEFLKKNILINEHKEA